jgi:multidrug efflux pump subunit AcrA (membrane-fusion protein)
MQSKILICLIVVAILSSCGKKTEETKPIRKDVVETVFASGFLEANHTYNLVALNEGYLSAIFYEEGDIIKKGNIMAIIDNKENHINTQSATELWTMAQNNTQNTAPLLAQAKANIELTKQKMDQEAVLLNRYQRLWENNSIAKVDYENAVMAWNTSKTNYEAAVENFKKLKSDADQSLINNNTAKRINSIVENKNKITALVDGKIYEKKKQIGDFVKKGDIIAVIGDPDFIYGKLNVDESSIDKIRIGQEASVKLNTNKDKTYKAIVYEIAPSFDENSQSFICKLRFLDSLDFNIIKTQLQANIITGTSKNALLIPRNYIDFGGYVQVKGESQKRKVNTKFISNQYVQVLNGIDANTILITEEIGGAEQSTDNEIAGKY